jgi:hypothetical protein
MASRTAITVGGPRDEVERRWRDASPDYADGEGTSVTFKDAPGDRGTEIHVEISDPRGGRFGEALRKLTGTEPLAKAKDDLRHFKSIFETGTVAKSDARPYGERHEGAKHKPRPAQPLDSEELAEVTG